MWKHRRILWPLATLVLFGLVLILVWWRANPAQVVFYNDSGATLGALTIEVCGQTRAFSQVEDQTSVRFKLEPLGAASEIAIYTNAINLWHGDYIEARGGYRAVIRVRRDGQVECRTGVSWWRQVWHGWSNAN